MKMPSETMKPWESKVIILLYFIIEVQKATRLGALFSPRFTKV